MPPDSLKLTLEQALERKRIRDQSKLDTDLLARAEQVRVLQGLNMQCGVIKCPHCGRILVDPRPKEADEDYNTRM